MESYSSLELFYRVIENNIWLSIALDGLLKSLLIASASLLLLRLLRGKLASTSQHMLLLNVFLCCAALPLIFLFGQYSTVSLAPTTTLFTIEVTPLAADALTATPQQQFAWAELIAIAYLLPVSILLLRLGLAAIRLFRIGTLASDIDVGAITQRVTTLRTQLNISRKVQLRVSKGISSPLSYGFLRPVILLPTQAVAWSPATMDDVLIHELSHIRRFDWLSMLTAYIVASVLWLNPLLWFALRRLNQEAENSCDSAVLNCGRGEAGYAENLLHLAKVLRVQSQTPHVAQMMLSKNLLAGRIHRILESDMARARTQRYFYFPLALLTLVFTLTASNTQIVAAELVPREAPATEKDVLISLVTTTAVAPLYPLRAAYAGVEGWALSEFTIAADGSVIEDSIRIADADPLDIFDRASIRAVQKFAFTFIEGVEPREIVGVQYLFRYELGEDDANSIIRDFAPISGDDPIYPQAAADESLEANVWTVFTVTSEGQVEDVTIKYSSNDLFNESAAVAARSLRFEPRLISGQAVAVERVQYLYRYTLD